MVRQQPIFTAPGVAPIYADETLNQQVSQQALANTALAGANLATLPAQVLDFALMTLRGGAKLLPAIDAFGAETAGQKPLGSDFAAMVEKNVPERMFTPAMVNAITFGNRENLLKAAGPMGSMSELGGQLVGGFGSTLALASKAPAAFKTFDTITDIATATPSQAFFNMAKTPLGTIGAGAGVGVVSSLLPAIDVGYNAQTGESNPTAAGLTMGLGTALGAAIPAALTGPQLAKQGKQVLDDIVNSATGMIKQSDNMQIVKQISQRALERQQMEAFTKVATEQMEALPPPKVPEEFRIEKTFSETVPGYEEIPNIAKENEEYFTLLKQEEEEVQQSFSSFTNKADEELNTLTSFIEETKSKPIEITDKEINEKLKIPYKKKDILNEIREGKKAEIKTERDSIKQELDTALEQQLLLKEKEANFNKLRKEKTEEELTKEFNKPIATVEKQLAKDIEVSERAISKIQKRLAQVDNRLEKTIPVQKAEYEARLAEVEAQRNKVREEVFTAKQTEQQKLVQDLEKEADGLFNKYQTETETYQNKLNEIQSQKQQIESSRPKLPVLREPEVVAPKALDVPETPARFIASKEGIKEIGPDGVEMPVIKFDETAAKTGVQEDGTIVVKGKQPVDTQQPVTPRATLEPSGKHNAYVVPITNAIKRISKPIGNLVRRYLSESRMIQQEMQKEFKPLKDILLKYQNDDAAMAAVRRQDLENVPEELRNAIQEYQTIFKDKLKLLKDAGLDIDADVDFYLPFRVKDVAQLKGKLSQDEQQIIADVFGSAEKAQYNDPEKIRILNRKLEKSRANMKVTPEMMIDYHSMPEALDRYISETADQVAQALLFDGNIAGNFYTDLLPRLLAKDSKLSPKQQQLVQNQLIKMFGDRNYVAEPMLKAYQSILGALTVTGPKTVLAQASSAMSNLHKFGLPSTLSSMYRTLKGLGKLNESFVNKLNPRILQELNDQGQIRVIGGLMDFLKNKRLTPLQKGGKLTQEGIFAALKAADFMEKETTYNAAYSWLKSKVGSKRFKLFLDEYAGAFSPEEALKLEQDLLSLKKNPKQLITKEVLLATDFLAGERLVLDFGDKSAGALSRSGLERSMHSLMSYAYKMAADETDRTVGLFTQAIKEKNWDKANLAAQNTASLFAIFLPGMILFENFKSGRPLDENITPQRMVRATLENVMPTTNRVASTFHRLQTNPNADEIIGNLVLPGSGTVLKTIGSAAKLTAEGRPQDIYNPEENPQYRYMPPRIATEYIYSKSDAFKQRQADQLSQNSPTLKAERDMQLLQDTNKVGLLNEKNVTDLKSLRKDLTKFRSMKSNLEYGTLDPLQAKQMEIIEKALPREKIRFRQQLEAKRSTMSEAQYQDLLKREDEIIMNKLIEWIKSGHTL